MTYVYCRCLRVLLFGKQILLNKVFWGIDLLCLSHIDQFQNPKLAYLLEKIELNIIGVHMYILGEGITRPVVSVSTLAWFILYIYY
jgi:hypothetical protein